MITHGLWFETIALAGLRQVVEHPGMVEAVSPAYGMRFLVDHGPALLAPGGAHGIMGARRPLT